MTGQRPDASLDQWLADLEQELTVTPSADLPARIRAAVMAAPVPWWRRPVWSWAAVAATLAVTLGGAWLWREASRDVPAAADPIAQVRSDGDPVRSELGVGSGLADRPAASAPARPSTARRQTIARGEVTPHVGPQSPEVLVPDTQRLAVLQMIARARLVGGWVGTTGTAPVEADGPVVMLAALEIPPITVDPIELPPGTSGTSGGIR